MNIKTGYKQTEIGVIPEDWDSKKLGDIATLKARIGWQGLTTNEYKIFGEYYLITGTEFKNGFIDWENCFYVELERYKQDKNIQIKKNDVLVTKDGTIGKIAFIKESEKLATLNSGVFVIRPVNDSFIPEFFYYLLMSDTFAKFLSQLSAGSTINHLYQKDFVNFKFQIPQNKQEQTAIAAALSDVDALMGELDKLIAKKRDIKQATMQQLLTGKKRLAGFSGEWEVKRLGEVAEIIGGGTPSTFVSDYWNGNINWFTPTEIGTEKYVFDSVRKITKNGLANCSARILPIGTILLTSRAGIGDIGILKKEACTNQGFQSLVAKDGFYNEFLYYLVSTLKNVLMQNASGSTFLEISPNKIKQIQISIPNIEEQTAIATILSDMDAEINALQQKRDKTAQLKAGMMQELLTGRIRLPFQEI